MARIAAAGGDGSLGVAPIGIGAVAVAGVAIAGSGSGCGCGCGRGWGSTLATSIAGGGVLVVLARTGLPADVVMGVDPVVGAVVVTAPPFPVLAVVVVRPVVVDGAA